MSARITRKRAAELHTNFLCMLPVAVARSSSDGVAIFYVLPVFMYGNGKWHIPKWQQNTTSIAADIPTKFRSKIKTGSTRCDLHTGGEVCCLGLPCFRCDTTLSYGVAVRAQNCGTAERGVARAVNKYSRKAIFKIANN